MRQIQIGDTCEECPFLQGRDYCRLFNGYRPKAHPDDLHGAKVVRCEILHAHSRAKESK